MVKIMLYHLLLVIYFSSSYAVELVTPELVLNKNEISEIVDSKNYFFRKNSDQINEHWDKLERYYSSHFMDDRTHFFDLNEVVQKTLGDGFVIRNKIEDLYCAGISRHIAWGHIIPSVDIPFGGSSSLSISSILDNLFGFLLPHHWMNLVSVYKGYDAIKLFFLKAALDELLTAQEMYVKLHKSIVDFEILNFYLVHLQLLVREYPNTDRDIKTIHAFYGNKGAQMSSKRGEIKILFNKLAQMMALEYIEDKKSDSIREFGVSRLNIRPLDNLPTKISLEGLPEEFRNKEDFVKKVVANSVELRALKIFVDIAKIDIGQATLGNTLNQDDIERGLMNLSVGYGTIPRILKSISQKRIAQINVQEEYLKMLNLARKAHDNYTNMIGQYTEATRSYELSKKAFEENIFHAIDEGGRLDSLFISSFENLLDSELRLNMAYHNALEAYYFIRRLSVIDEEYTLPMIIKSIPEEHEVKSTLKSIVNEYYDTNITYNKKIEKAILKTKRYDTLCNLLDKKIIRDKGKEIKVSNDDLSEIIKLNISELLKNPRTAKRLFIGKKSKKYYKKLYQYINDNQVNISSYNMKRLEKFAGITNTKKDYLHTLDFDKISEE